jgi:hypothetical protein
LFPGVAFGEWSEEGVVGERRVEIEDPFDLVVVRIERSLGVEREAVLRHLVNPDMLRPGVVGGKPDVLEGGERRGEGLG